MKKSQLSRRQFLGATAAASTVYSLMPHTVLGANNRVNIGIIGVGRQGTTHMRALNNQSGVNVVAVCDPDTSHMDKAKEGVAKHRDLRNLLEMKDLDAVLIATPNHWHSLATIMACQAGKHVYVEKPVSHSIFEGRKMVEAARKYDRIVQTGTQHRSCPGVIECAKDVQDGVYGKVLWAHCSKLTSRKPIGKVTHSTPAPSTLDYNLWAGPAPMSPIMRKRFHYDWHWQWNWGDGEMGNWGVHYLDDLRNILGWNDIPTKIQSAGNRWWDDDGETPNMHLCIMEHKGINIVVDIRNLPDPGAGRGGSSGAIYLRSRQGNYIACEKGYIKIARGGGAAYDYDNKRIKQYKGTGGGSHRSNFINAIHEGSNQSLKADIEIGHLSSVMCHQANIGYRIAKDASLDEMREFTSSSHEDAVNTLQSMLTQLEGNKVDLTKKPFILGPQLTYNNQTERFTGKHADKANAFVEIPSRKEFAVPDKV